MCLIKFLFVSCYYLSFTNTIDLGYKFEDLINDRVGIALNQHLAKVISMQVYIVVDDLFNTFQVYFENNQKELSENIELWEVTFIALKAVNLVGMSLEILMYEEVLNRNQLQSL